MIVMTKCEIEKKILMTYECIWVVKQIGYKTISFHVISKKSERVKLLKKWHTE